MQIIREIKSEKLPTLQIQLYVVVVTTVNSSSTTLSMEKRSFCLISSVI